MDEATSEWFSSRLSPSQVCTTVDKQRLAITVSHFDLVTSLGKAAN